jgi:uncharacterized protein YggE
MIKPFYKKLALLSVIPLLLSITPANASSTRYISLPASASTEIVPDALLANLTISFLANDNQDATKSLSVSSKNLSNYLKAQKINPKDIKTSAISLYPEYRYQENLDPVFLGVRATISYSVTLRDLSKAGVILVEVAKLDPNLRVDYTNLFISDPEMYQDQLRAKAIKKAIKSAKAYAKEGGFKVGKIISITENSNNFPPYYPVARSQDTELADRIEIEPGSSKVTLNITVKIAII